MDPGESDFVGKFVYYEMEMNIMIRHNPPRERANDTASSSRPRALAGAICQTLHGRRARRGIGAGILAMGLACVGPAALAFELSSLDGSNGFVLNGIEVGDGSGRPVSAAGDVNGDGIDDLIIGAGYAAAGWRPDAGESYVVFGTAAGFPAAFELSSLNGSNGFVLNGIDFDDQSGFSASTAGDINDDGIDDLVIGAPYAGPDGRSEAGESYVVFGSSVGFPAAFELSSLDGSNGFVLNGIDLFDNSGWSVSAAGDVNGDGIDDLIIGANGAAPGGRSYAGESYVVFGTTSGFAAEFELSNLNGNNGFVLNGIDIADWSGVSVGAASDVNGDGTDDLIIGANLADPNGRREAGESYVVFGTTAGFPAAFELSSLDGSNGFVLNGIDAGDESGPSVSTVGDVNGDGIDDLIIGALSAEPDGRSGGESYVVFGTAAGFPATFELSSLNGSNGFVLNGIDAGHDSISSVSAAGDVNGDGFDDLIIGVSYGGSAGQSYVVFGTVAGFPAVFELLSLDGSNGFVLNGIDRFDLSGISVSAAGDVNGDGIDDLIIGAIGAGPDGRSGAGESYVVFGRASWVIAPQITVTGVCPGEVTLSVTGGALIGTMRLAGSFALGSTTLPLGDVCAGTHLNLENAFQLFGTGHLDLDGAGIWSRDATASACGMLLQAVDDTTCEPSNVTNLP